MPYSKEQYRQLAKPHGAAGVAVLDRLNLVNVNINHLALDVLGKAAGNELLEIGFGGGALIEDALSRFPQSKIHGVEISGLAVERGEERFSGEIREQRVRLHCFDGQTLPFNDSTFDTVIAVNVIYFVADVPAFLRETRRVLKPGGRCVLGYAEGSPDRVTRFERDAIEQSVINAGFDRVRSSSAFDDENGAFHCTVGSVSASHD